MLYTDRIHLVADSVDELLHYGNSIGHKRCWFELHWRHPHYDLVNKQGNAIVNRQGVNILQVVMADPRVKKVTSREIVDICRVTYCFPQNAREMEEWEKKWGRVEDRNSVTVTEYLTKEEVLKRYPLTTEEAFKLDELTKIKRK